MQSTRQSNVLLYLGLVGLALAIGHGQRASVKARDRHEPLLFQLDVERTDGLVLRQHQMMGTENESLTVDEPDTATPRLSVSLLPLGLPDGGLDVQLRMSVDGTELAPLQGFKVTPGEPVHVEVPGQRFRLTLRAWRLTNKQPLIS